MAIADASAAARARAILTQIDLGDWSPAGSHISESIASIYGDGYRRALRLVGYRTGAETVNQARANLGRKPVAHGDVSPFGQPRRLARASELRKDIDTEIDADNDETELETGVSDDLVNQRAIAWANARAAELVTDIGENTRGMLQSTVAEAIEEGWSAAELATAIRDSIGFSEARSATIARTELIRTYNSAALEAYKASGVVDGKSWATAGDDLVEEDCEANEADGIIPIDDDFSSGDSAPPAHPNACFEGFLFAPYGRLRQFLRSRYNGPAVTIEASFRKYDGQLTPGDSSALDDFGDRNILAEKPDRKRDLTLGDKGGSEVGISTDRIRLTIGPNHPILTRRGFVIASEICEGDQLLYDARINDPCRPATETHLEKMPRFEDAFDALSVVSGTSFVAEARAYFHGDQIFAYGEVEIIRPTRDLLPILDPGSVEHLCECNLQGAYADSSHVSGCSTCRSNFDRVFHAASCDMGCNSGRSALFSGSARPPVLQIMTVSAHWVDTFSGWAFDASTESGLYNYGGMVVKNCRCALQPEFLDEGEQ